MNANKLIFISFAANSLSPRSSFATVPQTFGSISSRMHQRRHLSWPIVDITINRSFPFASRHFLHTWLTSTPQIHSRREKEEPPSSPDDCACAHCSHLHSCFLLHPRLICSCILVKAMLQKTDHSLSVVGQESWYECQDHTKLSPRAHRADLGFRLSVRADDMLKDCSAKLWAHSVVYLFIAFNCDFSCFWVIRTSLALLFGIIATSSHVIAFD